MSSDQSHSAQSHSGGNPSTGIVSGSSTETPEAAGSKLDPMSGGRWRPVRPEELLRKEVDPRAAVEPEIEPKPDPTPARPKVRLERRQELERRLKGNPNDLDSFLELGRIYQSEQRPIEAKRILGQAREMFPDDKVLLWDYEEATLARSLQQLREISELSQRLDTAETLRELRRSKDDWACRRIEVCRARLQRDPSLMYLYNVLGEALLDAGEHEAALRELDKVLEIDEYSSMAFLIRGRCLLAMGRDTEAMVALRAAALRRSVVAPAQVRVVALRMLCEVAQRLNVPLTLEKYRAHLLAAEQEVAKQANRPS